MSVINCSSGYFCYSTLFNQMLFTVAAGAQNGSKNKLSFHFQVFEYQNNQQFIILKIFYYYLFWFFSLPLFKMHNFVLMS